MYHAVGQVTDAILSDRCISCNGKVIYLNVNCFSLFSVQYYYYCTKNNLPREGFLGFQGFRGYNVDVMVQVQVDVVVDVDDVDDDDGK